VSPDQTLEQAQALMAAYDYFQLAVMFSDRNLKGAVSWRSIARAYLRKPEISIVDTTVHHREKLRVAETPRIVQENGVRTGDRRKRTCTIGTSPTAYRCSSTSSPVPVR